MKVILGLIVAAALVMQSASAQVWIFSNTGGSPPTGAGGAHGPVTNSFLLLVDNSSHMLRVDNTSKLCRIGSC